MWPANNPDRTFWTSDCHTYSSLNNLYLGSAPSSTLVSWQQLDFRLKPGSAAAKSGVVIPGYTEQLQPPCGLGAYEPGRPLWKPGADGWCQPKLLVARADSDTLKLTAPAGAAYFQLFSATNPSASAIWVPVTNEPTVSASEWSMTLPVSGNENRYFRLQVK